MCKKLNSKADSPIGESESTDPTQARVSCLGLARVTFCFVSSLLFDLFSYRQEQRERERGRGGGGGGKEEEEETE